MNGDAALNISIFLVIVAVTLYVVYRVSSRNTTTADYYATGGAFTGVQNRVALRLGEPADDPLHVVLAAVQHDRLAVLHLRRARHGAQPRPRRHRAVRRAGGPLGDGIGAGAS
jgi:hypothetical protein